MLHFLLACVPTQVRMLPPLVQYDLAHHSRWRTPGHRWEFRVYRRKQWLPNDQQDDRLNLIYCDNRVVKRFLNDGASRPPWEPWGDYLGAQPLKIESPFQAVVAIRGAGGLGTHWDTVYYGFRGARMTFIGRSPSQNANGPISWKGRRDVWLMDNGDWYRSPRGRAFVTQRFLFSISPTKGMMCIRAWRSSSPVQRTVWLKELE